MDQQQIKACIDAMTASDLAEMEFSQDGWTLRLVRRPAAGSQRRTAPAGDAVSIASRPRANEASAPTAGAPVIEPLCAPLYGVVHLAPAPGEPAFVSVGQAVTAGQVLCVIEAMKVFNQVLAEHDATVAEVLVTSGQEVDAGQPLLRFA